MFLHSFKRLFSPPVQVVARRTMSSRVESSPFTRVVVEAVRKLYPEKLADKSFDNTGLLLEAPFRKNHSRNSVLLTNDLTKAVADEAIQRKDSIIITYHPIIFRPLKSLTLANSQQQTLLKLVQEGISVYSPHTAVDAAPGGVNDWLADILTAAYSGQNELPAISHDRNVIIPVSPEVTGFESAGYGRIVRFHTPQKLSTLVQRIASGLGRLSALSVATPQSINPNFKPDLPIASVGICAGAGSDMLNGLDVDLLFTGEMHHHDALAAIEQGKCVITAFHSNTERMFLRERMQELLTTQIKEEVKEISEWIEDETDDEPGKVDFEVAISEMDRDPFEVVSAQGVWLPSGVKI